MLETGAAKKSILFPSKCSIKLQKSDTGKKSPFLCVAFPPPTITEHIVKRKNVANFFYLFYYPTSPQANKSYKPQHFFLHEQSNIFPLFYPVFYPTNTLQKSQITYAENVLCYTLCMRPTLGRCEHIWRKKEVGVERNVSSPPSSFDTEASIWYIFFLCVLGMYAIRYSYVEIIKKPKRYHSSSSNSMRVF